jgi:hypothetical protein
VLNGPIGVSRSISLEGEGLKMRFLTMMVLVGSLVLLVGCASMSMVETDSSEFLVEASYRTLAVPRGHLPPSGRCRVWMPGEPAGHQPPPGPCEELECSVPRGAWLIYGPAENEQNVVVSVYDEYLPQLVTTVRYYDARTGRFLREERLYPKKYSRIP